MARSLVSSQSMRSVGSEIELAPGVEQAELDVLTDRFMGTFGVVPSTASKLEHALHILSRHPVDSPEGWQGIEPNIHMGEACRMIWHEQLMTLLLNEASIRYSTDPEYVHDARVAIRRARAAARIYRAYFKPNAVRGYSKRLRRTAELLGAVRDLDVAIGKLESYNQKSKKRFAGDLKTTLEEWLTKRSTAYRALLAWLDSDEYAEFVTEFLQFCRTPGAAIVDMQLQAGEEVTPCQVRHVAPTMLLANFERVRAYETWFDQAEEPPVETLHRLRIECKYLRYNLEFLASLLGDESSQVIAQLRKLQDDLGDLSDAVVSTQLVGAGENGSDDKSVSRYEQAQAKIIDKLRM
jgi:CHAD domain-containing protein